MRTITAVFLLFAAALLPAQAARGAYDRDMSNVPEGERIFQEGYGSLVLECRASIEGFKPQSLDSPTNATAAFDEPPPNPPGEGMRFSK